MEEEILQKFGIKWEDLDKDGYSGEKETLEQMLSSLRKTEFSLDDVKRYITSLRENAQQEITKLPESPSNWPSLLYLFIPFLGIIRKWYMDQKQVEIRARLHCYTLIESYLDVPERARKAIERQLALFPKDRGDNK